MILRWFLFRSVRQASDLCHRVHKFQRQQRDLLPPQGHEALDRALGQLRKAIHSGADEKALSECSAELETTANKWLRPYPHAGVRENVDVILVAVAVAMAIRTFFLQPMAIPTGSMQPTLYGITVENMNAVPGSTVPGWVMRRFDSWFRGISYYHVVARQDGAVEKIEAPAQMLPLVRKQKFWQGGQPHVIWFAPATLPNRDGVPEEQLLFAHAGVQPGRIYRAGEDIIKLKVKSGDRLFADRFTYNFRRPQRGEIVIFASQGIPKLQQNTHYIKRLIALGREKVRIGNDRHVVVDGARLDAAAPGFENLYSFSGPPEESKYSGHVNNVVAQHHGQQPIAPRFHDERVEFVVQPKHYLVLGDNTMSSYDSRYWGDFPQEKVIGKCAFVFWPFSDRFGWGFR